MQHLGPTILTGLVLVLAIVLCVQNTQTIAFQLLTIKTDLSLSILLGGTFVLGLVPGLGFKLIRKQKTEVAKTKEVEWEKQDEKLAKEIGSDHVKQLEAKIETLEAALSAALKKKK